MWETVKKSVRVHQNIKVKGQSITNFKSVITILPLQVTPPSHGLKGQ